MKERPTLLSAAFVKSVNVLGRYGDSRGGLGFTLLVRPSPQRGCGKSRGQSIRINGRKTTLGFAPPPWSRWPWPASGRWRTPGPSLRARSPVFGRRGAFRALAAPWLISIGVSVPNPAESMLSRSAIPTYGQHRREAKHRGRSGQFGGAPRWRLQGGHAPQRIVVVQILMSQG